MAPVCSSSRATKPALTPFSPRPHIVAQTDPSPCSTSVRMRLEVPGGKSTTRSSETVQATWFDAGSILARAHEPPPLFSASAVGRGDWSTTSTDRISLAPRAVPWILLYWILL